MRHTRHNTQERPETASDQSAAPAAVAEPPVENQPDAQPAKRASKAKEEKEPKLPFWEFLGGLGERWQTEDLGLYVYRLWPITDKRNPERYLAKLKESIDEDFLLRNYGSGKYWLVLNNGHGKTLREYVTNPHNPSFPPRVDPLEVVAGDPRNDLYFQVWAKRKDGGDGEGKRESAKGETAEILGTIFEKGTKVDPALIDLWKEASKQRDELAKLLSEKKAEAPPQPAPHPDVLGIISQVKQLQGDPLAMLNQMKQLQADPLAMLGKLKEFFPAKEPVKQEEPNSLDHLEKMLNVFGRARDLFTAGSGAAVAGANPDSDTWEQIAVNVSSQIAPAINAIAQVVLAFKAQSVAAPPMAPAASPAAQPAPAAFNPYDAEQMRNFMRSQTVRGPAPAPQPGAPGPQPAAAAASPQAPPASAGQSIPPEDAITSQVLPLIHQALSCLNRGVDGHGCAAAFCDLNGDLNYEAVAQQIRGAGIPVLIELAKGIPEISPQVITYEARLKEFVEQFLEGPAEYDEEQQPA
jgi:hypothetical protein